MYLRDHRIPQRLQEPVNKLCDMWCSDDTDIRPSSALKKKQAVGCFVYNACYHLTRGNEEFEVVLSSKYFSQPLIYNCNKVKRKVSYTHTRSFLDWLVSEGLIQLEIGSIDSWSNEGGVFMPKDTSKSLVRLSSELIDLLLPVATKGPPTGLHDVIEVRDSSGNKITKRLGEEQKRLISLLGHYNHCLLETKIESEGTRFWVQAKKVFNSSSFEVGGRTYMVGDVKVLNKSVRKGLKIDDQETVELDYKALHIAIIAELEGVVWPDGFDPYSIVMEGYDKECLRSIVKVATLCSLNASNYQAARKALNYHIMKKVPKEWKEQGLVPPVIASTEILDKIRTRNPYLQSWLYEGKGGFLQHTDSLMMDYIIDGFQQEGTVILPIHDGIICQREFTEWGECTMVDAYEQVLGSKFNCKVEEK